MNVELDVGWGVVLIVVAVLLSLGGTPLGSMKQDCIDRGQCEYVDNSSGCGSAVEVRALKQVEATDG